ncbi:hypothetical protein BDV97DRAFT_395050 [Delphinella strobiligena]|nr:hypothetical protein BDV97DRAFT_395050 [Delphinella strobiligena]
MILIDHAAHVAGSVILLTCFAYILFPLRCWTRISNKTWGMDDTSMSLAMIPFTALTVFCLAGAFNGLGVKDSHLTEQQQTKGLMYFFFFEIFYCAAIIPVKLSISFMLMRIASPMKGYVWSLYGVSAMFTVMNSIAFLYIIFQCNPVSYAWDTSTPGGKCNDATILEDIYYSTTAVNITTDWFCALLPVPLLWSVQLNRNAKVSVACLLSLGIFASLSACIRLHYTVAIGNTEQDYLFGVADVVIWGYAENGIGVIVGCISTLRPLVRNCFALGGSSDGKSIKPTWPTNDRRAYQSCEDGYELPHSLRSDKVDAQATIKARRSDSIPGSESEEHILHDTGGIQISRTVLQNVSYSNSRDDDYLKSRDSEVSL